MFSKLVNILVFFQCFHSLRCFQLFCFLTPPIQRVGNLSLVSKMLLRKLQTIALVNKIQRKFLLQEHSGQYRAGRIALSFLLGYPTRAQGLVHLAGSHSQPYHNSAYFFLSHNVVTFVENRHVSTASVYKAIRSTGYRVTIYITTDACDWCISILIIHEKKYFFCSLLSYRSVVVCVAALSQD